MTKAEAKAKGLKYRNPRMRAFWILIIAASLVLVLPTILNSLANIRQVGSMGDGVDRVNGMTAEQIAEEKAKVRAYNEKIYEYQMVHGFHYQGENVTDEEYESLLSTNKDDSGANIMGYIEIPKIGVYLPIGHGTKMSLMQYAAGHMYGSSLPLGGKNTNAIITGHTGLSTARLFTDVKKLKRGNEIRIHVLDEIHRYKLTSREEVEQGPDETPLLQMEEGKDQVTLYTCSTYGVNNHRLILRFDRAYPDVPYNQSDESGMLNGLGLTAILQILLYLALPIGLFILSLVVRHFQKKKWLKSLTDDNSNQSTQAVK